MNGSPLRPARSLLCARVSHRPPRRRARSRRRRNQSKRRGLRRQEAVGPHARAPWRIDSGAGPPWPPSRARVPSLSRQIKISLAGSRRRWLITWSGPKQDVRFHHVDKLKRRRGGTWGIHNACGVYEHGTVRTSGRVGWGRPLAHKPLGLWETVPMEQCSHNITQSTLYGNVLPLCMQLHLWNNNNWQISPKLPSLVSLWSYLCPKACFWIMSRMSFYLLPWSTIYFFNYYYFFN